MSVCRLLLEKTSLVQPTPAQPSALPFTHSQGKGSLAPAVSPPQLPHQMLAINRDQHEAGPASGSSLHVLLVVRVCEQKCACASQHVCLQVCLQRLQLHSCSFGPLSEMKHLSHTRTLLAFCSPLPPHCFAKPQTLMTQQLNYREAWSWTSPSSSSAFMSNARCFPGAWRCQLLTPLLPSPFGSLAPVSPAQPQTDEKSSFLIHLPWVQTKMNPQLSFSEDGVGSVYSGRQ